MFFIVDSNEVEDVPFIIIDQVNTCHNFHYCGNVNNSFHPQQVYREHSAPVTHCQFSPNGVRVASVDINGTLRFNFVNVFVYCFTFLLIECGHQVPLP